ncbi:hypothetical protein OG337_29190 [[Kitasatospora] papulosa]|uniref:hypothetical protein n=1 Tax=[Kitasatospora] papulosa TaxID=1464011 RepID=UPI003869ECA1|nr:hypothetical protein OG337_29190 [[Kitasatospora] papulosa]
MGAALHLAHATELPTRKRKRKGGGGGGDGYDQLVARVYQDPRMTPEARELILLLAWLTARDPNRSDEQGNPRKWRKRASDILGEYGRPGGRRESRLADLLYADRPRYDFPPLSYNQPCAAPMIRREGLCGRPASDNDYEVDHDTGWKTPVYFCRRHEPWGGQLREQRRREPGPEPIPNAGGLVVSYLMSDGQEQAWARLYREAAEWKRDRQWEPPKGYGLRADDWPTPGQEQPSKEEEPFRLRLIASDGGLIAGAVQ